MQMLNQIIVSIFFCRIEIIFKAEFIIIEETIIRKFPLILSPCSYSDPLIRKAEEADDLTSHNYNIR
jgi:hypothetical protein